MSLETGHRRGAEIAEVAQRKPKDRILEKIYGEKGNA
jgi:hypothetical protein